MFNLLKAQDVLSRRPGPQRRARDAGLQRGLRGHRLVPLPAPGPARAELMRPRHGPAPVHAARRARSLSRLSGSCASIEASSTGASSSSRSAASRWPSTRAGSTPTSPRDLGQLWPLILVGIGLGLILRWTPFAWFGGALVAATFGIIFGAAVVALPDDDITNLQGIIPAIAGGACAGDEAGPGQHQRGRPGQRRPRSSLTSRSPAASCGVTRATDASWSLEAAHDTDDAPAHR